jgi:hypothetical protein
MGSILFPVAMIGLLVSLLCLIAGPKKIPRDGIDYEKIVHENGTIIYRSFSNGNMDFVEPRAQTFLERFDAGMDRIALG